MCGGWRLLVTGENGSNTQGAMIGLLLQKSLAATASALGKLFSRER